MKRCKFYSKKSQKQDREILRSVSNQKEPIRVITKTSAFPTSKSTVHRHVQSSKFYRYRRMCRTPMLKLRHTKARVLLDKKYTHWMEEWLNVLFSVTTTTKKINLDGPDGWAYYWHGL